DNVVRRKLRWRECGASVTATFAKDRREKIGRAIEHFGRVVPAWCARNVAFDPNELLQAVKISERRVDMRQHIHRGQPRGSVTLFLREFSAETTGILLAAVVDRKLPGEEQQAADPYERRIISSGPRRRRQLQSEFSQLCLEIHGAGFLFGR